MAVRLTDIRSPTEFKRHSAEVVDQLKQTGRPQVLTVNGKAAVVVQDAEAYQRLLDRIERAEAIQGIRRGLEPATRGEGRPAEEVFAEIRSKYDIPHEG